MLPDNQIAVLEVLMLFVGDDWAEDHHDVEVVDETGMVLARRRLPEGLVGVTALHALIAEHAPPQLADLDPAEAAGRVKVGIETDRGPWVAALTAAGYQVFAINPLSVSRYRQRHSTSGASPMPPMHTCWPRSSGWTGPTTDDWPQTARSGRRSSSPPAPTRA